LPTPQVSFYELRDEVKNLAGALIPESRRRREDCRLFSASIVDDRLGIPVRRDGDKLEYAYPWRSCGPRRLRIAATSAESKHRAIFRSGRYRRGLTSRGPIVAALKRGHRCRPLPEARCQSRMDCIPATMSPSGLPTTKRRDPVRRPRLREMLPRRVCARGALPCSMSAAVRRGDRGGAAAVPAAQVTLQDYSQPMLTAARRRLAAHAAQLRYVVCDLTDPSCPALSAGRSISQYRDRPAHLRDDDKIFACYRAVRDLLRPGGCS